MSDSATRWEGAVSALRRAVFLDRDGTLNVNPPLGDYVRRADGLQIIPDAADALGALAAAGYELIVFSNQSGIARGWMTEADVDAVNARLAGLLMERGVRLGGIYVCPHRDEDACECRKPKAGLLRRAARELRIELARSWTVGDSARDVQAGQAVGCRTVVVYGNAYPGQRQKAEALHPTASVATLAEASRVILASSD